MVPDSETRKINQRVMSIVVKRGIDGGTEMKLSVCLAVFVLALVIVPFQNGGKTALAEKPRTNDFALTVIEPGCEVVSAESVAAADPDWPFDVWINAGGYYYFYAYRSEDTALYGSFDVLTSSGIDFFLCDDDNFDLWTSGHTASVYVRHPSTGGADWEFIVPYSDTWYKMYDNTANLFYQSHVVGTHRLDITAPSIDVNLDDGNTYSGRYQIEATASDDGFGVASIQLYIDGTLRETEYGESLAYTWETSSFHDGQHTVRVRAYDGAGHYSDTEVEANVSNLMSLLLPVAVGIVGLGAIIGAAVFFTRRAQLRDKPPPSQPQFVGPEPVQFGDAMQARSFCPFCGSVRSPPTAKFCSNCGASFPE